MTDNHINLALAVFDGVESAEAVVEQLPRRSRNVLSVVVMQKDAQEHVSFKDMARTPTRGTVGGIIIGGVIGLLTGGGIYIAFNYKTMLPSLLRAGHAVPWGLVSIIGSQMRGDPWFSLIA